MKRVVLLQSNYIPWRGYFAMMDAADEFIVYDSCQYTVNDWRNRNQIKTSNGRAWLTIPVLTKGRTGQLITEAQVADHSWVSKHQRSIEQALGKAEHFAFIAESLGSAFDLIQQESSLHRINVTMLRWMAELLGVTTPITIDTDHGEVEGDPTGRVAALVARAGGTTYLTGGRGLDYLRAEPFQDAGIEVEVIDYSTMPLYPQLHGEFDPAVSAVDLLANLGPSARGGLVATIRSTAVVDGRVVHASDGAS